MDIWVAQPSTARPRSGPTRCGPTAFVLCHAGTMGWDHSPTLTRGHFFEPSWHDGTTKEPWATWVVPARSTTPGWRQPVEEVASGGYPTRRRWPARDSPGPQSSPAPEGRKRRPPIHGSRPQRRGGRSGRQPTDLTRNGGEKEGASEEEGATTALGDRGGGAMAGEAKREQWRC
jgi:hypothetical protein